MKGQDASSLSSQAGEMAQGNLEDVETAFHLEKLNDELARCLFPTGGI